jgi:hypothetical protein
MSHALSSARPKAESFAIRTANRLDGDTSLADPHRVPSRHDHGRDTA